MSLTYTTDEKARVTLPKTFANSTVLIEQISETELRIRKARVIPEDELPFVEETLGPLSDPDRDIFLALLDNPPPPNAALGDLLTSQDGQDQPGSNAAPLSEQSGDLMFLSWPDFFARVNAEQGPLGRPLMHERLQVLTEVRRLFLKSQHFRDLDYAGRRKVAGLYKSVDPNFLLFGSMQWVGHFKQAIRDNNEGVSRALDQIPFAGAIGRRHYEKFIELFLKAFKRSGMALAGRLLAMRRPDVFVCVNNQNRDGLFAAFGLVPSRDADAYWTLIERIRGSTWWQAPAPPAGGDERRVWEARAAFLDALFYSGV